MRLRLIWLLLALLWTGTAQADSIHVGHFSLVPGNAGRNSHELLADLPADVISPTSAIVWPDGCTPGRADRQTMEGRTRLVLPFACSGPLAQDATVILPWRLDGASLRLAGGAHINISPEPRHLSLPVGAVAAGPRPLAALARDYLWQGIIHILTGWDHLAFVLCLCLLARGRQLLLLVTLFTLGHSISLAAGFFEWISLPMPPVEAVIALSILFMAREALLVDFNPPRSRSRQAMVVAAFGVLHGLGFASALAELGVPADDRVAALLFFNLGVEAGQLLFVAAVLAVLALAGRTGGTAQLRTLSLHAAGAMAAFWLLERMAGFAVA
jgi:hypothetical protein